STAGAPSASRRAEASVASGGRSEYVQAAGASWTRRSNRSPWLCTSPLTVGSTVASQAARSRPATAADRRVSRLRIAASDGAAGAPLWTSRVGLDTLGAEAAAGADRRTSCGHKAPYRAGTVSDATSASTSERRYHPAAPGTGSLMG